ncbi:MAG: Mevalonate kinase [Labilithrix sp.]|nr:Mevalonate kinase [Labilithrix sp.]
MTSRGTAHGKVILFGEHAVVHGVPALAVGIERGAWAEASARPELGPGERPLPSSLYVRTWGVTVSDDVDGEGPPLARAFRDLLAVTRASQREAALAPVGALAVEADADLPPGGGLGCSAALGVAVARAASPRASTEALTAAATAWERVFHGNPSGIDAAVALQGGCVHFTRTQGSTTGVIERVRLPVPMQLCIGHSGVASSTKAMVEAVARMRERRPEATQRTFDAIHTLVKNARPALEAGDHRAVGQLMDLNQMLLSGLFLSTPEIEQMCEGARSAGALGAKLTGAGGGGCVVALVESAAQGSAVIAAWKALGFEGFGTTASAERTMARETQAELDVLAGLL